MEFYQKNKIQKKMSSSIRFFINTSSNNFISTSIDQLTNNIIFAETSPSPTASRALFEINNLPLFLVSNGNVGVYLGKSYPLKLISNGISYFLQQSINGYQLSNTCSNCVTITVLSLDLFWSTDTFNSITPNSFISTLFYTPIPVPGQPPGQIVLTNRAYFYLSTILQSLIRVSVAYPPISCPASCETCGYCPSNFSCNNGLCSSDVLTISSINPPVTFGLRTKNSVITYTSDASAGYYLSPNQISVDYENTDISGGMPILIPQRWFYIDLPSGQGELFVGKSYPIYIYINNRKFYITMNSQIPNGFKIILSPMVRPDTLTFVPTKSATWGDFVFTNSDFLNGKFVNGPIALWQNNSLIGSPAVLDIIQTIQPSKLSSKPKPILAEWWFWLLIVGIILLIIIIGIYFIAKERKEKMAFPINL